MLALAATDRLATAARAARRALLVTGLLSVCLLLVGCGSSTSSPAPSPGQQGADVSPNEAPVDAGEEGAASPSDAGSMDDAGDASAAAGPTPLRVAISFSIPPYVIRDEDRGMEYDLVDQALAAGGYALEPVYVELGQELALLEAGEVDAAMTLPEDADTELPLSEPYITYEDVAITLAERDIEIASPADLAGRSVGAFQGAADYLGPDYAAAVADNPAYTELADQAQQNIALYEGDVEVLVSDIRIFEWYDRQPRVRDAVDSSAPVDVHPIFAPTLSRMGFRDPAARDAFDSAIAELRASGRYEQILAAYDAPADAAADALTPVRVAVGQSLPPYVLVEERSGMEYQVVSETLALAGMALVPEFVDFGDEPELLAAGEVEAAMTIGPDSGVDAAYSEPYIDYRNMAMSLASAGLEIASVEDLAGHSVLAFEDATTYLGPDFAAMADANQDYREVADQSEQVRALLAGEVDVVVSDVNIFDWYAADPELVAAAEAAGPVAYHELFPPTPYRMAFQDHAERDAFDAALRQLRESGRYDQILASYAGELR